MPTVAGKAVVMTTAVVPSVTMTLFVGVDGWRCKTVAMVEVAAAMVGAAYLATEEKRGTLEETCDWEINPTP